MKRLVTADWQIDMGSMNRYRTDFVLSTLPALREKHKPDQLLVLGDITEKKDAFQAPLVNDIVGGFYELSKLCQIIILQGNHDFASIDYPFFKFLDCIDNITWISVPTELDDCFYLPHTRDYGNWHSIIPEGCEFIFAHNIFTGVQANGGELSGIPLSVLPVDSFCIAGDVHEPQMITDAKRDTSVLYVGSPILCDFGDSYHPRVLLLDGIKVKSIKVYGQNKRLINVIWDKQAPNGGKDTYFDVGNALEGDIVKLQVHIGMEHVAKWPEIRQQVETWAIDNKFVIHTIQPVVLYELGERQKHIKSVRRSDSQYVDAFVKRSGIDPETSKVGHTILDMI